MVKCLNPKCNGRAIDTFCKKCVRDLSVWTRLKMYLKADKAGLTKYRK